MGVRHLQGDGRLPHLHQPAGGRGGHKLAINFDIDNTSLASHYDSGAPVAVTLRYAKHARAHGVNLLFNTGRERGDGRMTQGSRPAAQGRLRGQARSAAAPPVRASSHGKQRCRRHFVNEGYTIIANVGNRSTDFTGGNYERAFRLPNYGNQLS